MTAGSLWGRHCELLCQVTSRDMVILVWQSDEAISFSKRVGDEMRDRFAKEARDNGHTMHSSWYFKPLYV